MAVIFPEGQSPNTATNVDAGLQTIIASETIYANEQYMAWHGIAEEKQAEGNGTGVTFVSYSALAINETALDPAVNPDSAVMADTPVLITINEQGNPLILQERLSRSSKNDVMAARVRLLATNMAESVDSIAGGVGVAGTNVRFINAAANAAALIAGDKMNRVEVVRALTTLKNARAPRFPNGLYAAVVNPAVVGDLFATGANLGEWMDFAKYDPEMQANARVGEIGRGLGFTWIEASQKNITTNGAGAAGGGNTVGDLVKSVFCGFGYMGYAWQVQPFLRLKPDPTDSMERFLVAYWKGEFGYGRVREANAIRVQGRSAYAANV